MVAGVSFHLLAVAPEIHMHTHYLSGSNGCRKGCRFTTTLLTLFCLILDILTHLMTHLKSVQKIYYDMFLLIHKMKGLKIEIHMIFWFMIGYRNYATTLPFPNKIILIKVQSRALCECFNSAIWLNLNKKLSKDSRPLMIFSERHNESTTISHHEKWKGKQTHRIAQPCWSLSLFAKIHFGGKTTKNIIDSIFLQKIK